MTIAGWCLAVLGWGGSLALLPGQIRQALRPVAHVVRWAPEFHVFFGLVAGVGAGLLWGWPWGLGAGLAQGVGLLALLLLLRG